MTNYNISNNTQHKRAFGCRAQERTSFMKTINKAELSRALRGTFLHFMLGSRWEQRSAFLLLGAVPALRTNTCQGAACDAHPFLKHFLCFPKVRRPVKTAGLTAQHEKSHRGLQCWRSCSATSCFPWRRGRPKLLLLSRRAPSTRPGSAGVKTCCIRPYK